MGREFELKYRCSDESFEALKAAYPHCVTIEMATTYYDTFDGKLSNRHWTLRRRMENGKSVCTPSVVYGPALAYVLLIVIYHPLL